MLRYLLPHDNSHQFFKRVLIICTLVHLIILCFLFLYRWQKNVVHISRQSLSPATVVYVPWVKRFNQLQQHSGTSGNSADTAHQRSPSLSHAQRSVRAGFVTAREKIARKKKIESKKKVKNKQPQKQTQKKKTPKETTRLQPQKQKKEAPRASTAVREQPLIPAIASVPLKNQISDQSVSAGAADLLDQPIYIGRDEKDEYELVMAIQEDIKTTWRPPVGFTWKTPCIARLMIDDTGKTQQVTIEQSSGIAVVDINIRTALEQIIFSSEQVRGKQLTLSFAG